MAIELTIAQACKNPQNFMYVWADEQEFLSRINPKYAAIIRGKKANQNKLLRLSAEKYNTTYDEYTTAIRQAFIDAYGMTPAAALVALAQGKTVAGKNWAEGVFGIGSTSTTFYGNPDLTVNTSNGHILKNGVDVTDTSKTVYENIKGVATPYQLFYVDTTGASYMSQYNKTLKKYYAQSYTDPNLGITCSAKSGKQMSASDSATIWETVILSIQTFIDWLISLFGGNSNKDLITSANTLPDQKTDGFVQEAGFGEAGLIVLALVAGGTLLATGSLKKKKNN